MSKIIVVIGVTGIQGSSVAKHFLSVSGWKVRGITRDPSSNTAQSLTSIGVELIKGDLEDLSSLHSAFSGATAIFANTDFFAPFIAALSNPGLAGTRSAAQYACDTEIRHGTNIAEAASSPDVLKTLERFVYSSLSDAAKWSKGKYQHVYHNNCKVEVLRVIEKRFPELARRMSKLEMGHYVQNWKGGIPAMVPQKRAEDGVYITKRTFDRGFKLPFVLPHEDTGAFVKALIMDLPAGKHMLGVSKEMTMPEWTKLWGKTLDVRAEYEVVSMEEFFQGVPQPFVDEMRETFGYAQEFGFTGGDPKCLTPDELGVNAPVTPLEEYIKKEDWSSVL